MQITGINLFSNTARGFNSKCKDKTANLKLNSANSAVNFKSEALDLLTEGDHNNAKKIAAFLDKEDLSNLGRNPGCHNSENVMVYIYNGKKAGEHLMKMILHPFLPESGYEVVLSLNFSKDLGVIGIEYSNDYANKKPIKEWEKDSVIKKTTPEVKNTLKYLADKPENLINGAW